MKDVTLKQQELGRLHVLNNVLEYQTPVGQAAEILGVSERRTRRLLNAYRKERAAALAHGNRDAGLTTPSWMPKLRRLCGWPAPSTRVPITLIWPNCSENGRAWT